MTYWEKLKDPRWQKRRLEIMKRDEFTCQDCHNKEYTLNVHHKWYEKNQEPWDADDQQLITVCEVCHNLRKEDASRLRDEIRKLYTRGYTECQVRRVLSTFGSLEKENSDTIEENISVLFWLFFIDPITREIRWNTLRSMYDIHKEARARKNAE